MPRTFGKLCTGILIKATGLINCIVSMSFFPIFVSFLSLPGFKWRGRFVWSYGQSQKSKPVPFPGMAVNTVYSEEIHPHALWMTLGASVHCLCFWQLRAGSSKILLNMETHAALAERQRSNTLSKARFREGEKKALLHTVKSSQSSLIQLCKLAKAIQHWPAAFFLSEKTSALSTAGTV